ncbi:MAG TPA: WD40 repeat domain-containing protein, partial [Gemmataceae bacterium]|nr:WD40 repeat domain-containing protein [Gemmataceae bacterium]
LVEDLRQVRVQQPDNTFRDRPGPYVEPVHLSVVCKSLWETDRPDPALITQADIDRFGGGGGSVDRVLAAYYGTRVEKAAGAGGTSERRVREWFDKVLISAAPSRRSVPRGEEVRYGVTPGALELLGKAYLVREESRSGGGWLELARDRLIGPVRRDHADWRGSHPSPFRLAAAAWVEGGRPAGILIDPAVLREGEHVVAAQEATDDEAAFLKAALDGEAARAREVAVRRATFRNRLVGAGLGALIGLAAVTGVLWREARKDRRRAEERAVVQYQTVQAAALRDALTKTQEKGAQIRYLNDRAREITALGSSGSLRAVDPVAAVAEAEDVVRLADRLKIDLPAGETALRGALERLGWYRLQRITGPVRAVAFSPNGKWVAVGGPDFGVAWWAVRDGKVLAAPDGRLPPDPERYGVTALAFAPDNANLLLGTKSGSVYLWRLDRPLTAADYPKGAEPKAEPGPGAKLQPVPVAVGPKHAAAVRSIQVASERAPDGRPWVVSVGTDGGGFLWKWQTREVIPLDEPRDGPPVPLTAVGFTPYPKMLYAGSTAGAVSGWDLRAPRPTAQDTRAKVKTAVTALAIHPEARFLAVAAYRSGITLWPMDPYLKTIRESIIGDAAVLASAGYVDTLAFHPTGGWLAAESRDKRITVYRQARDTSKGPYEPFRDRLYSPDQYWPAAVYAFDGSTAAAVPGGLPPWLLVGAADGPVRLWDLAAEGAPFTLPGGRSPATAAAVSPDRTGAVVGCQDGSIHYYDVRLRTGYAAAEPRVFYGPDTDFRSAAVSPDRRLLVVYDYGRVLVWDLTVPQPKPREITPAGPLPAGRPQLLLGRDAVTLFFPPGAGGPTRPVRLALPGAPAPVEGRFAAVPEAMDDGTAITPDRQWVVSVRPAGQGFELTVRPITGAETKVTSIPAADRAGPAAG